MTTRFPRNIRAVPSSESRMSKETWDAMVKVMSKTQAERPRRKRKTQRQPVRCVREDHYELLLAAQY